ncbi:hypothetical protein DYBT9275_00574 [Dyadobacter sp. CECT 9275]|uniref:DUF2157 domain-containing protein n=1 Tax=Dyadobacter helix TaxID=2822344 RepID=A0A916N2M3_9BACT|nr:hypothetical protein [Dyadobacter sp. CECT 9275]CAG4990625.1 hypothetical protein DYBT9275_00574 [Dyadobacter sp. CECT 9275]
MKLDKKEEAVVHKVIRFWQDSGRISPQLAEELKGSYEVSNSSVDAIALYALISAVSCGLLAFGALVIDEKWIELLRQKWGFSETIVAVGFTLLSVVFIYIAGRRKIKAPDARTSNETYNLTIVLAVGIAITYWTRSFSNFDGNYAIPLLIAAFFYGLIAAYLRSKMLWMVMLVTLSGWWGAQTHFWAGGKYRFAGMNYPLRMTIFGLAIWISSWFLGRFHSTRFFEKVTYNMGLFLFLLAAWTLSIFGNYEELEGWAAIRQGHFWYWALGFTLVLAGLTAWAMKQGNDILRDTSLAFFLLNIYTRYFEYFWDRTNKGIFFAILALSFWFVARKAEQWRNKESKILE